MEICRTKLWTVWDRWDRFIPRCSGGGALQRRAGREGEDHSEGRCSYCVLQGVRVATASCIRELTRVSQLRLSFRLTCTSRKEDLP